jgi:Peptidase family C25/FlgD Ig-like domain/Propeptide_C25
MRTVIRSALLMICIVLTASAGAMELSSSYWTAENGRTGMIDYTGRIELSGDSPVFIPSDGSELIELENCTSLVQPGAPVMPAYQIKIALPMGLRATGLRIVDSEVATLNGSHDIVHGQPAQRMSTAREDLILVDRDETIYGSDSPWPLQSARLEGQTDYAGQAMAVVTVYPLSYTPSSGEMRQYSSMTIVLECESGYELGDYAPVNMSQRKADKIENQLKDMVINSDQAATVAGMPSRSLEAGDYDLVIIYPAGWQSRYYDFKDWKNRKGAKTNMIMDFWIYNDGGYSGDNASKLRAFIIDAHTTWGATDFLIGGDTNMIPTHYDNYGDNIPNDTWYADYDHDWTCEVNVGRIPARYASEAEVYLDNMMAYEKTPPMTDFCAEALFLGFNLDGDTAGENCKMYIDNAYMPANWTVNTVYDSHSGNHKTNALAGMDAGVNIINHIDHAETTEMGLGSEHNYWLYQSDVNNLTNASERGILYSMGCFACNFDQYECIGETFVKADNGGLINFVGNSLYGWYNPGLTNTLSFLYDIIFFRSIFQQNHINIGSAFSDHKNDHYPTSETDRYVWTELTLLGDPQHEIWTANPTLLTVDHVGTFLEGSTSLSISVSDGGGPRSGATVCLYKEDDGCQDMGTTDGSGNVVFDVSAVTLGDLLVTVTGHNLLPYEGTIIVADDQAVDPVESGASFSFSTGRNPFFDATALRYQLPNESGVELVVYDLAGRLVRTLVNEASVQPGSYTVSWDGRDETGRQLFSGVYLYRFTSDDRQLTKRAILLRD